MYTYNSEGSTPHTWRKLSAMFPWASSHSWDLQTIEHTRRVHIQSLLDYVQPLLTESTDSCQFFKTLHDIFQILPGQRQQILMVKRYIQREFWNWRSSNNFTAGPYPVIVYRENGYGVTVCHKMNEVGGVTKYDSLTKPASNKLSDCSRMLILFLHVRAVLYVET